MELIAGITLEEVLVALAAVVAAASAIVKAADVIAGITPSTADDEFVGAARRVLGKVIAIMDRFALNPDSVSARPAPPGKRGPR